MEIDTWKDLWWLVVGAFLGFLESVRDFLIPIKPLMLFCALCIITDLVFGIAESYKKGIKVRSSRAMRRTLVKGGEYLCFCLLAGSIQMMITDAHLTFPLFSLIVGSCICCYEISSIINHWLVLHDRKEINFRRLLTIFLKRKNKVLGELSEEYERQQDGEQKTEKKSDTDIINKE